MSVAGIDETHDPGLRGWVESARGHGEFPVQNLPLGVFSVAGGAPRIGVAIGEMILDIAGAGAAGLIPAGFTAAVAAPTLNALFSRTAKERRQLRRAVSSMLSSETLRTQVEPLLHEAADCVMHLPCSIGDYTDFYVGIHHATNVGSLYRPDQPLTDNYKHLPIGYHGRASSIRVDGEPVVRPKGQSARDGGPQYGVCQALDYELELAVWIGPGNPLGNPIPIGAAHDHVAGLGLLNDWSARDIQHWERLPLGPFLGKSFHSSVSPWIVTPEALAPFRTPPRPRSGSDPQPLPYLSDHDDRASGQYSLRLEASILTPAMRAAGLAPAPLSRAEARDAYWTIAQMVAHQTSNGCNLQPGDLLGSGTISAPGNANAGSLLEITRDGKDPVTLPNGETRTFVEDGDEIILTAHAHADGAVSIGFGECRATVAPARA